MNQPLAAFWRGVCLKSAELPRWLDEQFGLPTQGPSLRVFQGSYLRDRKLVAVEEQVAQPPVPLHQHMVEGLVKKRIFIELMTSDRKVMASKEGAK